jgi:hypothetical protein
VLSGEIFIEKAVVIPTIGSSNNLEVFAKSRDWVTVYYQALDDLSTQNEFTI